MAATSATAESFATGTPVLSPVAVTRDARQLNDWLLALEVQGIPALPQRIDDRIALYVPLANADAARVELEAVEAERDVGRIATTPSDHDRFHSRYAPVGAAVFALALLAFYLVTGPSAARSPWFVVGVSDASRVLAGEWWRTVTALTLHADSNHVLSNIALGAFVIAFVMRRTGVGLGAALVVAAGTLGNIVNAWGYGAHHSSIGFSTAVFGAIGILGGLTFVEMVRARGRGRPAWVAIAGTLALLAMLGASERSDMLAHLFGMLAGLGLGGVVGFARWRPRTWLGQSVFAVSTIAFVVGAWLAAFASVA